MRFMTWNCLGMGSEKQTKLTRYMTSKTIDIALLQEGDMTYTAAESEANDLGGLLMFDRSSRAIELLAAASSSQIGMGPSGGVSRSAYYNLVTNNGAAFTKLSDAVCVDYLRNTDISKWLLQPAQNFVDGKRIDGKKLEVRRGVIQGAGASDFKAKIVEEMLDPVQKRLNLMGHRRPKAISVTGRTLRIYYWHAPLGGDVKLNSVGYSAYDVNKGDGCGGEVAVAANILFSKHLGIAASFPADTILVGDLNINAAAAQNIYKTTNVISSNDGWCHALANPALALTSEVTTLDQSALGYSDHAPIVFTIA